ncbi:meprin A subunit alpha-like [Glandiceps talaboti]
MGSSSLDISIEGNNSSGVPMACTISPELQTKRVSSLSAIAAIEEAIHDFHMKTCIRFQRKTQERDYIELAKVAGCSSKVGRSGGVQQISIDRGCEIKGIVIHEMLHAIGLWHEHSRYDRDDHVTVHLENVIPGKENNFDKVDENRSDTLGVAYDYGSVMHYSNVTFSKNTSSSPTITPKIDTDILLGQRDGFSDLDIVKVNLLYDCGVICPELTAPSHGQMTGDCCLKGNTVTFYCEIGYTLYGSQTLTCQADGTWSANHHRCEDKYVYIETSYPRIQGDNAIFVSPVYPAKKSCLHFHYHMYGAHVDTLTVYVKEERLFGSGNLGNPVLTLNGNQGNEWKMVEVLFEGIRGSSYCGDIAIDDISLTDGLCLSQGKVTFTWFLSMPTSRPSTTE